ncbi:peptide chain release factor, putative [Leishmania panamensis]|uniref:Peptide chain release factor, putative n=3 Tax=Leishmania guyanensis species complex TaxID=38579 RepID=A0A088RWE5_LEIPA|nr:peptide chain release factor, putative [Leishmania panamensis]AIO00344.1 peptide chain release factor, putative [Leishmania panamensis]
MPVRLLLGTGLVHARRVPRGLSPMLSCCTPHHLTASLSSLTERARASHISSFKESGYYRLENPKRISIDPCVYEIRTMRGSGPGGQGVDSSSNKVELRADMELLSEFFDEELLAALRRNEAGGALTADGTTILVSCHEHRSALQNKEGCLRKLQALLHKASWVPPVEADPVERPSFVVTEHKGRRRKKSNMGRMTRSARCGLW